MFGITLQLLWDSRFGNSVGSLLAFLTFCLGTMVFGGLTGKELARGRHLRSHERRSRRGAR